MMREQSGESRRTSHPPRTATNGSGERTAVRSSVAYQTRARSRRSAHAHADGRFGAIGLDMGPGRRARQIFVARDPDRAQLGQRLAEFDLLQMFRILRYAAVEFRDERLLFGTDSSFFPRGWQREVFDAQKAALAAIGTDEATEQKIFGGNFDRLFSSESAS